jgi:hypothetical protein
MGMLDAGDFLKAQVNLAAELEAKEATAQIKHDLLANRVNLHLALGGTFCRR